MEDPKRFADAFNYFAFNGKQVVQAELLTADDVTELGIIMNQEKTEAAQKFRDVLKKCIVKEDDKYAYLLMGIENHTDIHYALPVKNMIYDALNYGKQVTERAKEHKKKKDLYGDEFLSGFLKTDKLKPVITLVIYFGTSEWDAPRTLKEMFEGVSEQILRFVPDYKVNLIVPKEIEDFSKFHTDLGKVMKYIAVADQKELLNAVAQEEAYQVVNSETARLLKEVAGVKIKMNNKKEVNMCKALQDMTDEARADGMEQGMYQEFMENVLNMHESGMDAQTIARYLKKDFELVLGIIDKNRR